MVLAGETERAERFFAERRRGVKGHFSMRRWLNGKRPFPHDEIYRATLAHAFSEGGFERRSALLVIDVQNDFISGTLANPHDATTIVPVINDLRGAFEATDYRVFLDNESADLVGVWIHRHHNQKTRKSSVGAPQLGSIQQEV